MSKDPTSCVTLGRYLTSLGLSFLLYTSAMTIASAAGTPRVAAQPIPKAALQQLLHILPARGSLPEGTPYVGCTDLQDCGKSRRGTRAGGLKTPIPHPSGSRQGPHSLLGVPCRTDPGFPRTLPALSFLLYLASSLRCEGYWESRPRQTVCTQTLVSGYF